MADDPLTDLDMDVITISRDGEGMVSVDGGELSLESVVYLLRAAEFVVLLQHFESDEDDDE
jgi:hypothetical protein